MKTEWRVPGARLLPSAIQIWRAYRDTRPGGRYAGYTDTQRWN